LGSLPEACFLAPVLFFKKLFPLFRCMQQVRIHRQAVYVYCCTSNLGLNLAETHFIPNI
jgi:hypothetical protein